MVCKRLDFCKAMSYNTLNFGLFGQKFKVRQKMEIKRPRYLGQLISYQWDGQVKVITGIRRCGKSYLLNVIYKNYII